MFYEDLYRHHSSASFPGVLVCQLPWMSIESIELRPVFAKTITLPLSGCFYRHRLGMRRNNDHDVDFWNGPEHSGWLMNQGEYIKTWRHRWFVLNHGKLFSIKENYITRDSNPRGVVSLNTCLIVKGAEDVLNKPFSFVLSTSR